MYFSFKFFLFFYFPYQIFLNTLSEELASPVQSKPQENNLVFGPANSGRMKSYRSRANSVSSISPLFFTKEEPKAKLLHQHSDSTDCSFDAIYSGQNDDDNHNYNHTYNEMNKSSKILTMTSGEKKLHDKYDDHLMQSISQSIKLNDIDDSDLQEDKIDQIIFNLENKEKQEMFNLHHHQNQIQNMEIERNIVNRSLKFIRSLSGNAFSGISVDD